MQLKQKAAKTEQNSKPIPDMPLPIRCDIEQRHRFSDHSVGYLGDGQLS